jgi:pyruvate/2-oxoglutarate dehydrogenase complex dihydrolipoamide dehydrogenase (E3) component
VPACVEILPYPSGLPRNVVQCLDDFGIPLLLGHTVSEIHGKDRVEGVTISRVDAGLSPVAGTERRVDCDTLLLSVGLIPENELSRDAGVEMDPVTGGAVVDDALQTSVPGVFACGNVLHVHDLVDSAAVEAQMAGASAWTFVGEGDAGGARVSVEAGDGVRYVVPQRVRTGHRDAQMKLRVVAPARDISVVAEQGGEVVGRRKVHRAEPSVMVHVKLEGEVRADAPVRVRVEGGGGE